MKNTDHNPHVSYCTEEQQLEPSINNICNDDIIRCDDCRESMDESPEKLVVDKTNRPCDICGYPE